MLVLMLIAKILIVVVVEIMIGGASAMVVVFVVPTDVVLMVLVLLIMATVVIVLVVWWRCTGARQAGRRRRRWWRYQYVELIFRKIQIIIDIVVLAAVVLLEHVVGVLDSWRLRRMLVACGVVEILILFQLVNQWTPLGVALGGTTADIGRATAATVFVARGVVFQYPNRAGMVVQQLFLVIKSSRCRSGLLTGVVAVVVPAGGVVGGIGT